MRGKMGGGEVVLGGGWFVKETRATHCVPTYFMFHLVSWRVVLAVYLDLK